MKVLYLENHRTFAATVCQQFLADAEVAVAVTVAEALGALREGAFDVVLVDHDLDGEKGTDFVMQARAAGCRVPMVAVSSHDEGNEALRRAGANATCPKLRFHTIRTVLATLGL